MLDDLITEALKIAVNSWEFDGETEKAQAGRRALAQVAKNKLDWLVNRVAVDEIAGRPVSDEEWAEIADEIGGRVDCLIEEISEDVVREKITQ